MKYRTNNHQKISLIEWVPLLILAPEEWTALVRACYEVAKAHGFRPPVGVKMSLLGAVTNSVRRLAALILASPGSFKALIADEGGVPSLWTTDTASRRQLAELIAKVKMAEPVSPDDEQRHAFESAVEGVSVLEREVDKFPDDYAVRMGGHPAGWPVMLKNGHKSELPPTPKIVERLSFSGGSQHLFDIFRPRRGGSPDIEGTNIITGQFLGIAMHLWGGKKLLSFDSPDDEAMAARASELIARPDVPNLPGLRWFLNERKDPAAEVPQSPTSKATVRLVWKLLKIETDGHPEHIRQIRQIRDACEPFNPADDKQVIGEILHEFRRHFSFLKYTGKCSRSLGSKSTRTA